MLFKSTIPLEKVRAVYGIECVCCSLILIFNQPIERLKIREALIKSRLTTWHTSCLQIFRHLARKLLEIRKYSCVAFVQADKKSGGAICAPDLISTSLV